MNEENQIQERYNLTIERMKLILEEESVDDRYLDYFRTVAQFILLIDQIQERNSVSLEKLKEENLALYQDVIDNYDTSYANPEYAIQVFGREIGEILSFLYTEIRSEIAYVYEKKMENLAICNELFIEIYNSFEEEETPNFKSLKEIIYWYASDYCDVFVAERLMEKMDSNNRFAIDIIMNSDLDDLRYLYKYGEYISDEEYNTVAMLQGLSKEEVSSIADMYIEGFQEGCEDIGVDLSKKDTIYIQYQIGTERIVKEVVKGFERIGLKATSCRNAVSVMTKEKQRNGFYSKKRTQYEADHWNDQGLFINKKYVERKLDVVKNVFEQQKERTAAFAGGVLIGVGDEKATLQPQKAAICLNEKQEILQKLFEEKMEQLTNKYLLKELNITVVDIPENH